MIGARRVSHVDDVAVQRTESVLTFFAQDGDTHNLVYAKPPGPRSASHKMHRFRSPLLRAAELPTVAVPWWGGRRLRYELPPGKAKVGPNSLFENPS